jgi:glycosyltransferase involved in cell wall biosynthesis
MNRRERPLRILCVVNLPWDARLGASRVWMELAEQWRAAGHTVDHYTLGDAFPKPTSHNVVVSLRQIRFIRRAARFIRKNAARYDVIDALLGTVPFAKSHLRFRGLLVARSVGFYLLYEKFHRQARRRWPGFSRGKLVGRIFYSFAREHAFRAAARAIRHADLLNLPNADELKSLKEDTCSDKPATIQPYGLTDENRLQLAQSAAAPATRLATPRICFLGMWSVRKGARDLGEIVGRIRATVPDAAFRFLGTFTADENVLRDLGLERSDWCEIVREYEPPDLASLLSDCTAGIFPSYVEGFGLGLIEQLAAGVPTVAYDAPGPRQILRSAPDDFLVPAGNVEAMSTRIVKILRSSLPEYVALQKKSLEIAAQYSWPKIAAQTIAEYRSRLPERIGPILCTQPFGWRSPGGGARIMRALLQDAPQPVEIICTSPQRPPAQNQTPEIHLPPRPSFGRVERSRFAGLAHATAPLFARRFIRNIERLGRDACAIHAVAHGGLDFAHAFRVARAFAIPFFLHLHDDFVYTATDRNHPAKTNAALARAWAGAAARFVISDQLGQEYQRRYGRADYVVITDGLEKIAPFPRPGPADRLKIYFMGLFHLEYEPNLRTLLASLEELRRDGLSLNLTMRCGGLRRGLLADFVRVLPFAEEAQVERDLSEADLLYFPLPFDAEHSPFVRFSLSTKLVTYLGSGVPILYHGPAHGAASELLTENHAALCCASLDHTQLSAILRRVVDNKSLNESFSANAIALARSKFSLPAIREKFWGTISQVLAAE